jgi:hypothetical protein
MPAAPLTVAAGGKVLQHHTNADLDDDADILPRQLLEVGRHRRIFQRQLPGQVWEQDFDAQLGEEVLIIVVCRATVVGAVLLLPFACSSLPARIRFHASQRNETIKRQSLLIVVARVPTALTRAHQSIDPVPQRAASVKANLLGLDAARQPPESQQSRHFIL